MAMNEDSIQLQVLIDTSGIDAATKQVESSTQKMTDSINDSGAAAENSSSEFGNFTNTIGQVSPEAGNAASGLTELASGGVAAVVAGVGLAIVALKKYIEYMKEATEMATKQALEYERLSIALENFNAEMQISELEEFNAQLQSATGLADDAAARLEASAIFMGVPEESLTSFLQLTQNLSSAYGITEDMAARSLAGLVTEGDLGMLSRYNKGWQEIIDSGGTAQDVIDDMIKSTDGVAEALAKVSLQEEAIANTRGDIKEARGEGVRLAREELGVGEQEKSNLEARSRLISTITNQNSEQIKNSERMVFVLKNFWQNTVTYAILAGQAISLYWDALGQSLGDIFSTLWDYIKGGAEVAFGAIFDTLSDKLADMLSGLATAFSKIPKVGADIAAGINSAADALYNSGETLKASGQALLSSTSFSSVKDNFDAAAESVAELQAALVSTNEEMEDIQLFAEKNGDTLSDSADNIASKYDTVMAQIEGGFISAAQAGSQLIQIYAENEAVISETNEKIAAGISLTTDELSLYDSAISQNEKINELLAEQVSELESLSDKWADVAGEAKNLLDETGLLPENISNAADGVIGLAQGAVAFGAALSAAAKSSAILSVLSAAVQIGSAIANWVQEANDFSDEIIDSITALVDLNDEITLALKLIGYQNAAGLDSTTSMEDVLNDIVSLYAQMGIQLEYNDDGTIKQTQSMIDAVETAEEYVTALEKAKDSIAEASTREERKKANIEAINALYDAGIISQETQLSLAHQAQSLWTNQSKLAETISKYLDSGIDSLSAQAGAYALVLKYNELISDSEEATQDAIDAITDAMSGQLSALKAKKEYLEAQQKALDSESDEYADLQAQIEDNIAAQIILLQNLADRAEAAGEMVDYYNYLTEIQEYQNSLIDDANEAYETQAELIEEINDLLSEKVDLGLIDTENLTDQISASMELKSAGLSGTDLASSLSSLGFSNAGKSISIGSIVTNVTTNSAAVVEAAVSDSVTNSL